MRTEDLTGRKYGNLTVIGFDRSEGGKRYWNCLCDCGNTRSVMTSVLNRGFVTSCGCMNKTTMIDLTGKRFGRLLVTGLHEDPNDDKLKWDCVCDCGTKKVIYGAYLRNGQVRSCGCLRAENEAPKPDSFHSQRLYGVWRGMLQRCSDQNHSSFNNYGGRGISVCDEWKDYRNFRDWAYANGYDEDHDTKACTLDRIDVNGNYCPDNCRWVDRKTQSRNTRRNYLIEYKGELLPATDVAEREGVNVYTLIQRLKGGCSLENALKPGRVYYPNSMRKTRDLTSYIPQCKPVLNVETGCVFQSVQSAAEFSKVSPSAISVALRSGGTSGGYHWRYADT